jgi:hypothetical protein
LIYSPWKALAAAARIWSSQEDRFYASLGFSLLLCNDAKLGLRKDEYLPFLDKQNLKLAVKASNSDTWPGLQLQAHRYVCIHNST